MYNENKDGDENKNCHYKLSNLYKQFRYEAHMLEKPSVTSPWKPWGSVEYGIRLHDFDYYYIQLLTGNLLQCTHKEQWHKQDLVF